ncbi:MAG: hypothetical protein WEE66_04050 [Actinomycetota bacterium]
MASRQWAMDESSLRAVAREGLGSQPKAEELATWCKEYGTAAADSRYFVLAETFDEVSGHWEQALPVDVLEEINRLLAEDLPSILDADVEVGTHLAVQLQSGIREELVRWAEWRRAAADEKTQGRSEWEAWRGGPETEG